MSALRGFFDIREGERRNTLAAFATLLAITTGHTMLETARDAFFLAKMPASRLPVMVAAVITAAFSTMMLGGKPTANMLSPAIPEAAALAEPSSSPSSP